MREVHTIQSPNPQAAPALGRCSHFNSMRLISSIYLYCAVMWAVHAAPLPIPQITVPSDSVDQRVCYPSICQQRR
jgi:hypothetical protein